MPLLSLSSTIARLLPACLTPLLFLLICLLANLTAFQEFKTCGFTLMLARTVYITRLFSCCVCYTCGPNLRPVFDISVLDGLWCLCSKYRASLSRTPRPFSVSACFTGRPFAGSQRRFVNIAETAIGPRVQPRDALHLLQRRQRRSSFKVIQLDDFKT